MSIFRLPAIFTPVAFVIALVLAPICHAQEKPAAPPPDVLIFTNGDQLTGKLVRGLAGKITFHSDMAGDITVAIDKVKGLRVGGNFAILRNSTPVITQPVVPGSFAIEDGKLTVAVNSEPVETMPVKEVAYILDEKTYNAQVRAKQTIFQGWNGSITGGATLVRSSSNGATYNLAAALIRTAPLADFLPKRNRTTVNFTETYGKLTQEVPLPKSTVKTSIMHADAERDEYLKPHFFYLGEVAFDHNYSQGLDLQQVYGGGFGWTPIQKPTQQLDFKADIHYEKQRFFSQDPTVVVINQNLIGSTITETYRRNLPRKIVLTETADVLPAFNNSNAYSANASVVVSLPLYRRLNIAITTTDNFLNNPAPGYQKNSYQFNTGISYNLR